MSDLALDEMPTVSADSDLIKPPLPVKVTDYGIPRSLLYSGSKFVGQQKSKGNGYDVEVILQVGADHVSENLHNVMFKCCV